MKNIVYNLGETIKYFEEKGDYSRAVEFYENELERSPSDINSFCLAPFLSLARISLNRTFSTLAFKIADHPRKFRFVRHHVFERLLVCLSGVVADTGVL
jgi:hypothetical protein